MSIGAVQMHAVMCDGACGRQLGWSDTRVLSAVVLCTHCVDHPNEVEARLEAVKS